MENTANRAIAIVGVGAVLPDAPNAPAFWNNVKTGRYSITEVSPERWDPALYFDSDHSVPDKTYSKIGGWVREYVWDPMKWRMPVPPRVVNAMDEAQKWAIACTREALEDFGYPNRALDTDRTAVILGNAMAGEKHYFTAIRVYFPEYATELSEAASFAALPVEVRNKITGELHDRIANRIPDITEDSMPGELANCIAGRIANTFNFHGPNYVVDAACASAMAAFSASTEGLIAGDYDTVITGGIDRNMGASTFVKFCKIGALSASGTRPYAEGADGFVMGEGAAIFVLKRLADAERDGDKIYAVIRGVGGASDGKGKGITAPNPVGQKLAIERAWMKAGLSPATVTMMEGHGTSTRVGDVVEVQSMKEVLSEAQLPVGSVALGSVKSNIGHLKGAAGAAGMLKAAMALRDKVLPPSLHCEHPSPDADFTHSPLYVNTELKPWTVPADVPRRVGVSAFGFGGTNFHVVMEEYIPGKLNRNGKRSIAVPVTPPEMAKEVTMRASGVSGVVPTATATLKAPLRGALVIGGRSEAELVERLRAVQTAAHAGNAPEPAAPADSDLRAPLRLVIDYADAADLADKSAKALKGFAANQPAVWKALRPQGIFRGQGPAPKVAFLYTGQGSQYVNMIEPLRAHEPIVADLFVEADRIMTPMLGKPLSQFIFVDPNDPDAVAKAEEDLRQTEITQPTVLTIDLALTRLLAAYGIKPDMTMGHSLGEYGALVAAGALTFENSLAAVSARGRGMTKVAVKDNGKMAAVFAPLAEVERVLKTIDDYVVIANINSGQQSVIGGASKGVDQVTEIFLQAGFNVVPLPVSHAFHTSIVAPASEPLREMLEHLDLQSPKLPVVANVNGQFYPTGDDAVPQMLDLLALQVASPVQFVKGLNTLYDAGARVFVEVGPKKALQGFAEEVLGSRGDVVSLFTNHPKVGDIVSFNQALCGLYAAGLGCQSAQEKVAAEVSVAPVASASVATTVATPVALVAPEIAPAKAKVAPPAMPIVEKPAVAAVANAQLHSAPPIAAAPADVREKGWDSYQGPDAGPVTITGAALGLPGTEHIFDDGNVARLLRGQQFISQVPPQLRNAMLDKRITRLVKSDNGGPTFETITDVADVIKLAGRGRTFDLVQEFGVSAERMAALDRVTALAIGAGLDALRDAGIPLVLRYKTTSKGTQLPDRWGLPDALRDDTGVVFASAFPGYGAYADEMERHYGDHYHREQLSALQELRARIATNGNASVAMDIDRLIIALQAAIDKDPYVLDRRFLFRVLSMGHSQFAEFIGARGPNTQVNAACASTTQAVAVAEDWIRAGRCRRVVILSADDITTDNMIGWFGAGFLASGAAATDELVENAALPFDRRRHGMIIGMGAAALVVESPDCVRERGMQPICEVLSTVTANSAFHGTRLDVQHIGMMMERLLAQAEQRTGIARREIAPHTVFVSHETYTPARGGSASAEIHALRNVFGDTADQVVIANTKGFTGHAMAAGVEDVLAVKALETGCVPPVANFKEIDPELGALNLSKGGSYPVEYALRLGAGFGSQISMTLLRWVKTKDGVHRTPEALGYAYRVADPDTWRAWLKSMSGQDAPEMEVVNRTLRVRDPRTQARADASAGASQTKPIAPVVAQVTPVVAPPIVAPPTPVVEAPIAAPPAPVVAAAPEVKVAAPAAPVAPVPTPVAKPVVAPLLTATPADDSVKQTVLALVAEKTGYPPDMLDLDLDLEADLGVDTVKQAEVFAAIRETYGIHRDDTVRLRDYPTLSHVIAFVHQRRPDLVAQPVAASQPEPKVETPVAAPSPKPVVAPVDGGDAVKDRILELAVEKTGYPRDMLDLDLDLEADLGVDTVKQAEMFAAIREIYGIPRDENRKLRDYPTLAAVIRFVYEQRPDLAGNPQAPPPASTSTAAVAVAPKAPAPISRLRPPLASFGAADRVPRRVPVPNLRPPLDLCKPTGVTLGHGSRVVIMPDTAGVSNELTQRLRSMDVEVLVLDDTRNVEALTELLQKWTANSAVQGVYWLSAIDREGDIRQMDLLKWHEALRVRVKSLYTVMRALYQQVSGPGKFLMTATTLGGQHGYDDAGAVAPLGGAVVGFTKTYKRERPDSTVKAVDFEASRNTSEIVGLLLDETLRDPGAVEIGYKNGLRWTVGLKEIAVADGQPGLTVDENSVFVITGAAGSIVSAITADLAAASGGTFYLLDVVPTPDPNNPDLARFTSDKDGLKRDLFARIQARGERATPALVEKELAALERAQAAQNAIDAVHAAGGRAHYFSANLTDAAAVAAAIEQVRREHGHIDVLLHAAGLERSHFLHDKDQREFDLVFDVKSDGWFNLLHAIGDMPLGATVGFSSIAGRFGNAGQCDYSAANDLLCKIASSFRTNRPATRGIVIDWTAWGGIGMATRGSIPKMMELAGIDMLPPEAGVPWIRRELTAGGTRGEVVVADRLGIMLNEWDETGGLDLNAFKAVGERLAARGPMSGKVTGMTLRRGLTMETTLDPSAQPFLYDHRIDGTPVLPGVMGIEAFAEAAVCVNPGWCVESINEVNFLAPFKFYRNEPRTVFIEVLITPQGDNLVADCRLIGRRTLPNQPQPQETLHFTARVRVTKRPQEASVGAALHLSSEAIVDATRIYRIYFHGPAYQVIDHAWRDGDQIIGQMAQGLPSNHQPSEQPTLAAPRLVELCFQTAGLWDIGNHNRLGLPLRVERVSWSRAPELATGPLFAVVTPDEKHGTFDAEVVDTDGNRYVRLSGYQTVALPDEVDGASLQALQAVTA